MSWIDVKYINLIAYKFRNFRRKGNLFSFSCPYCGDSKHNLKKARGYIYQVKADYVYHCHKCGKHTSFRNFVKDHDEGLYRDYVKDCLIDSGIQPATKEVAYVGKKPVFKTNHLSSLEKISALPEEHFARSYVESRKIPSDLFDKLYFCKKFKSWVNSVVTDKFEDVSIDEPRLIIPFFNQAGELIGFQGRSLKTSSQLRYITIMLDDGGHKLYGLDRVDTKSTINVVEGPIDSMFLPNCIASAGGVLTTNLSYIDAPKEAFTVIYDNEPRSKFIVKKIESAIANGYRVCIWPECVVEKDLNDMVLAGKTLDSIQLIVADNTYAGLTAKLKLNLWKKVHK